jgi:formylglycine-generating enzyme required for sulfatase activity
MVVVPAGTFMMGSPPEEEGRSDSEGPQRQVTIAQPLAVGKFEVTFAEWDACVSAGACRETSDEGWGRGRRPAINVTWNDIADSYLPWLSRKTGKRYRLLTEAEWEYAARAGTTTAFHFGDDGKHLCVYGNAADLTAKEKDRRAKVASCRDGHANTAPVGSFKANAFGLHDMHGNVWEWVQDCNSENYANAADDASAETGGDCTSRVLRGGAWIGNPLGVRSASRYRLAADGADNAFGFRVARPLQP